MDRKRVFAAALCLAFLAVLLGGGVVLAANGYGLSFYVIGGGGGHSEAGVFAIDATVGQAIVGEAGSAPYGLCSGFWCWGWVYSSYLPLGVRSP
jgi:hypothetical protein